MALGQFKLTIEDGILLHLLHYSSYRDEFEVPYNITQPGIAEAIGIRRSHVSYVIKGLKIKGFVDEKIAHIPNMVRKRKIYFLTGSGMDYAIKLRNNVEQRSVGLIEIQGDTKRMKLSEVNKQLSTRVPLLQLFNLISKDNTINSKAIVQFEIDDDIKVTEQQQIKSINFIDNMTQPTRFVGRSDEVKRIKTWIDAELPRIIVILGIPGIGKTTLAARVVNEYSQKSSTNLFWFRFHEWDTLRGTLSDFGEFLSQLGRRKLGFYLQNQPTIELSEIMKIIELDMQSQNILMVFDDFQKSNKDIEQLFSIFVELIKKKTFSNIKIVILTRNRVTFYDRRQVAIKKLVAELELNGLGSIESKQLLNSDKIEESEFEKIYKFTAGHPLTLELIGIHISSKGGKKTIKLDLNELFKEHHDINKYIREEIFLGLSAAEKKLLEMVSVFRYPVQPDAYFIDSEIDYECIDKLVFKSLIHETKSGYDLHELIKEFFYRRLTPQQRIRYHTEAAKYHSSELMVSNHSTAEDLAITAHDSIEAQYHYLHAGKYEEAGRLLIEHGEALISKGYTEELIKILIELKPDRVSKNTWAELLIHNGLILTINGEWDKAMRCYQDSLQISRSLENNCGIARANNAIGVIYYRKGDWKRAMKYYKQGLDLAEAELDDQNCSKLNSNLALIHWGNGDLDLAIDLNIKSLGLAKKLGDKKGIARTYNNLGIIYWEKHKFDEAIDSYNKSLGISMELGDKQTIAILYDNLGEAYRLKEDIQTAEEFYHKSLSLSEDLGFKWQIAEVNCNLGILYKNSDKHKSKKYLDTALELYTALGAKREVEKIKGIFENR